MLRHAAAAPARPIPIAPPSLVSKRRRLDLCRIASAARAEQPQPPPPPLPPAGVAVAPLGPGDAANAVRLHRAARLAGVPVFGDGAGVAEAIQAACAGEHGAFGFAAVDEQEVAEGDDGLVGAVVAQQDEDDEEEGAAVVLLTIAVRADRRRQGIGRALVGALAARAAAAKGVGSAKVVADVARDNAPARALLERSGFAFSGDGGGAGGGGGKKKGRAKDQAKSIEGVLEL